MAALELHFIEGPVSQNDIEKAIQGLELTLQRVSQESVTCQLIT